jgi:hypothetical protein
LTSAADDGIVVVRSEKGRCSMSPARISGALLERLGEPAAAALREVLDEHEQASTEAAMIQCAERFERRLVEETSKLRVEIAHESSSLRCEMREGFAALRGEIAASRFELLKWAFVFWVGQLVGVAGIIGLVLRSAS